MINIDFETKSAITPKDINSLLAFAVGEAETDGFVNRYVFEHAAYTYLCLLLADNKADKDEITKAINEEGVLVAWQSLLASGKAGKIIDSHPTEVQLVGEACGSLFDDYSDYARSTRAAIVNMQAISNDVMRNAVQEMSKNMSSDQYKDIMSIAEKWGMNQAPASAE